MKFPYVEYAMFDAKNAYVWVNYLNTEYLIWKAYFAEKLSKNIYKLCQFSVKYSYI